MRRSIGLIATCGIWLSPLVTYGSDIVAGYPMDRVVDNQLEDASGNGNSGRVAGGRAIVSEIGPALQFRGDGSVNCGQGKSLELPNEVTLECWVRLDAIPAAEVTVAGKGPAGYGLTFYRDGNLWWYINGGETSIRTGAGLGVWTHVIGTFDGKVTKLYVDGKEVDSRPLEVQLSSVGDFQIGTGLNGAVGGVRVYRRAMSAQEVEQLAAKQQSQIAASFERVRNGIDVPGEANGYLARVGDSGAIEITVGEDAYVIDSRFSYPGEVCGWHELSAGVEPDGNWRPKVRKSGEDVVVDAKCEQYSLQRTVHSEGHRVCVTDKLTNTGDEDVGILYELTLKSPERFAERLLGGMDQPGVRLTSENPSIFVASKESRLGWLAEDDVLRLQMDGAASLNSARVSVRRFALRQGESYTFRWAIYPQPKSKDYWDFVNQVRRDWQVNTTVEGPTEFWDVSSALDLLRDHDRLKEYLHRKRLKVIALMPWLDYDNYNARTGRATSREELAQLLKEATTCIKQVDPSIRCIGCIEANLVTPKQDLQDRLYELASNSAQNQYPFTDGQMNELKAHKLRWLDCLLMDQDGRCRYEVYYRGPADAAIPMVAIAVYPAPGNAQHQFWLEQAAWMLDEVGLDGLYIDQFNMAFDDSQRYTYDKWDGRTVQIDADTGKIVRRLTDAALVGIDARRSLADYVTGRGGFMLANTFPATKAMQTAGVQRFNESEWRIDVRTWEDGEMPPLASDPCKGHFSTPLALGFRPKLYGDWGPDNYARIIHKGAIAYLRHGLLYSHYNTEIPTDGPGAGEYGAINHMFPLTPVEVRPGSVIGEERIVTCVSGTYRWNHPTKPSVKAFDMAGLPCQPDVKLEKSESGWNVDLELQDWSEIAILE
jgi:hypothetical protein